VARGETFVAVTTEYGKLAEALGDKANDIDSLVVEGKMGQEDFLTAWKCSLYGELKSLNLEKAEVENGLVPDYAFYHFDEQYGSDGRMYSLNLTTLLLPEGVTEIGSFAFAHLSLEQISLPSTLKKIGEGAFANCRKLQGDPLVIPEGVETIPHDCFRNCQSLVNVQLPSTLRQIESGAFYDTRISGVSLPDALESIGPMAFYSSINLKSLAIPAACVDLGDDAFSYCDSLADVIVSEGVTSLPARIFQHCVNLKQISLPQSLTTVGNDAFYYCNSLRSVSFGDGIESIGRNAFAYCALDSVVLPASLKYLGSGSFAGEQGFSKIYSLSSVPPECEVVGEKGPFYASSSESFARLLPIYVPVGAASAYQNAAGWNYFSNYIETSHFPVNGITAWPMSAHPRVDVAVVDGGILLTAAESRQAESYEVLNLNGGVASRGEIGGSVFVPCGRGVYVVRTGQAATKVVVR